MAKILTEETKKRARLNTRIKMMLSAEFGLDSKGGIRTVRQWFNLNKPNSKLTTKAAVRILARELNLKENEILQDYEPTN